MDLRGALLAAGLTAVPACDLPRDPEETLERVRGGTLRVGVIENEPWTRVDGDEVSGVEADLVREFAATLDADVAWVLAGPDALEALEHFELDLVVGGLDHRDPWKQRVGLTRPWFVEEVCIGERGAAAGDPVYVEAGDAAAREVKNHPIVHVHELSPAMSRVLAPDWRLQAWGHHNTGECPLRVKHVMAVPPGENGLAVALERFLVDRGPPIRARLVGEGG